MVLPAPSYETGLLGFDTPFIAAYTCVYLFLSSGAIALRVPQHRTLLRNSWRAYGVGLVTMPPRSPDEATNVFEAGLPVQKYRDRLDRLL